MKNKIYKLYTRVLLLFLATTLCLSVTSCKKAKNEVTGSVKESKKQSKYVRSEEETDLVMLKMADGGEIVIALEPKTAPITVDNFKKLVKQKFYNNLTFHRAVPNFVIQGGDPNGDGTGGAKETITGEFADNGVKNTLADNHERGVVSMARNAVSMDSASSQFFIVLSSSADIAASLNGKYAAFGKVVDGMNVVDSISKLETVNQVIKDQPKINEAYFVKRN